MNIYFMSYLKATEWGLIVTNIDKGLYLCHSSSYTEIGQCACINIEDEKYNVVYRLFYDQNLYEMQPVQARG
jgi:hypothetical protein